MICVIIEPRYLVYDQLLGGVGMQWLVELMHF